MITYLSIFDDVGQHYYCFDIFLPDHPPEIGQGVIFWPCGGHEEERRNAISFYQNSKVTSKILYIRPKYYILVRVQVRKNLPHQLSTKVTRQVIVV